MFVTRKFKVGFLREVINSDDEVFNEIIDHSRWSVGHRCIFQFEGKLYSCVYSVGATEQQDEGPFEWNNEEDLEECYEVRLVEKLVKVYEEIKIEDDPVVAKSNNNDPEPLHPRMDSPSDSGYPYNPRE